MVIPDGASICPYCRSKINTFGFFGDMVDSYKDGYKKGSSECNDFLRSNAREKWKSICFAVTISGSGTLFLALYFGSKECTLVGLGFMALAAIMLLLYYRSLKKFLIHFLLCIFISAVLVYGAIWAFKKLL